MPPAWTWAPGPNTSEPKELLPAAPIWIVGAAKVSSSAVIPNRGLRHLAIRVTDVERAKEFYSRVFGMKLVWQPDPDNAYLSGGCDNLALHRGPSGDPQGQRLDHLGFIVATVAELETAWQWANREGLPDLASTAPSSRWFRVVLYQRSRRQRYPGPLRTGNQPAQVRRLKAPPSRRGNDAQESRHR